MQVTRVLGGPTTHAHLRAHLNHDLRTGARATWNRRLIVPALLLGAALPTHGSGVPEARRAEQGTSCPAVPIPKPVPVRGSCGVRCGWDRWSVKTLSDPDARRVNFTPVETTVESLATIPRPRTRPQDRRVAPVETTVYCIEGWVVDFMPQADRDIHLVVAGLVDTAVSMITEIPDVRCSGACRSGYAGLYATVRKTLEDRLKTWTTDTLRIRVMGVGFIDRNHGQVGAPPNFIELHPVLAISFP